LAVAAWLWSVPDTPSNRRIIHKHVRDGIDDKLSVWVVMPNHTHSLLLRFEDKHIEDIVDAHKGYTAHKANEYLNRSRQFWMEDYFDRFIRNEEHYWNTVRYIETIR
jgi:REP element-mobilizing transposase RayT